MLRAGLREVETIALSGRAQPAVDHASRSIGQTSQKTCPLRNRRSQVRILSGALPLLGGRTGLL